MWLNLDQDHECIDITRISKKKKRKVRKTDPVIFWNKSIFPFKRRNYFSGNYKNYRSEVLRPLEMPKYKTNEFHDTTLCSCVLMFSNCPKFPQFPLVSLNFPPMHNFFLFLLILPSTAFSNSPIFGGKIVQTLIHHLALARCRL